MSKIADEVNSLVCLAKLNAPLTTRLVMDISSRLAPTLARTLPELVDFILAAGSNLNEQIMVSTLTIHQTEDAGQIIYEYETEMRYDAKDILYDVGRANYNKLKVSQICEQFAH